MELDIGHKIAQARKEAKLTQEKAAEEIGISRQTLSNWENEKYYPDIVSVIRMSDLYGVSLDYLLKGEDNMNNYMTYLQESTDTVRSNERKTKIILISSYLVVWCISIIVFWFFTSGSDAMGYGLVHLWILQPITMFVVSLLVAKNQMWHKKGMLVIPLMGIMYMLCEYCTFSMANNVTFDKVNIPSFGMIPAGMIIAGFGYLVGWLLQRKKK